jgi:hypothetical protein
MWHRGLPTLDHRASPRAIGRSPPAFGPFFERFRPPKSLFVGRLPLTTVDRGVNGCWSSTELGVARPTLADMGY